MIMSGRRICKLWDVQEVRQEIHEMGEQLLELTTQMQVSRVMWASP